MTPAQHAVKVQEHKLALQRIMQKRALVQTALTEVGLVIDDFNRATPLPLGESTRLRPQHVVQRLLAHLQKAETALSRHQQMDMEGSV